MIKRAARIAGPAGLTAMLLAVSACESIGNPLEAIGATIPPPDEFQVIAHKPLVMPAFASLPEPRPGAPSPLDPDPHRDALNALFGTSGSPVVSTIEPGAGEQALLSSANAAAASSDIRFQLEEERIQEEAARPYEPPSLGELLGGSKGEKLDESQLLDPVAESQRLQREGYLTPVDPNATVETEEEEERVPVLDTQQYPPGRPENTFKVE
ncbi:MAG: DUF3035 domain-containing protein [Paracoccaceae bacterium]